MVSVIFRAAKIGELGDQRGGDDFVVFAADFDLREFFLRKNGGWGKRGSRSRKLNVDGETGVDALRSGLASLLRSGIGGSWCRASC